MENTFVEQNIERLIKQCENGDDAMSFLAIYSFIEGYFRDLYPNDFKWEKDIKFNQMIDFIKSRHLVTSFPAESKLYDVLKKYHGEKDKNAYKNLKTFTDTNRVRHCFSDIREGTLSVIVEQFIEFAQYRGFLTEEISAMNDSASVSNSRKSIKSVPSDNSILYNLRNDLLAKYDSFFKYKKEKEALENDLEKIDSQLLEITDESQIHKLIQEKKNKTISLKSLESQFPMWQEYSELINELAISLIEARTKKKVESQIIHLSESQKRLIKEDIDALTTKEGHSMYIKGGPGTGKTLVLIVILFRFYASGHKSALLTYYPTLNKYISYLFELYNDDKLLNYFGISKINTNALENLGTTGILKFDEFLLPNIKKHLKVQNTYSINDKDKVAELAEIVQTIEPDHQKAAKLYEDVIENVLPNMLDEKKYCTNPRRTEKWSKISRILEALDNSQNMLDLYAYYKFGRMNIDKIALTNESYDYILIDEAQDLTNAQIFAINKFVNPRGGLILAGDPSQEIRNKRITMAQLDVNISGGARYSQELTVNFRSSQLIQDLGNEYKQEPCLHIRKNTKSVEGITAGPPPQIFLTDDTETSNYCETINQIINSVKMCTDDLCIVPENICIVAFNEKELLSIQELLRSRLNLDSVFIYKDFSFKSKDDANGKIRLCTLKEIKGIDCAVLLFMITDQSKPVNHGDIKSELKANAIYTCITRAMYLLQVFMPKYCRMSDLSVAVLVNKMLPDDEEVAKFIEEQRKKELKGIPLKQYFDKYSNKTESEILKEIEISLKKFYEIKFGSSDNCYIDITQDCGMARIYSIKRVVSEVQDSLTEITIDEAKMIKSDCKIGDDDIYVYINPGELIIEREDSQNFKEKEYIHILEEAYQKCADRRTNQYGAPLPYSSEGFLNIAGCGLSKPYDFGYEKWPELIKDNLDVFDYVIYNGKGTVKIFAFRPKLSVMQVSGQNNQTFISPEKIEEDGIISAKLPTLEQIKYAIKKAKKEDNGTVLLKNARAVIKEDFDITVSADMLKVLVIQNPSVFELSKNLAGKNAVRIIGEEPVLREFSLITDEYTGMVLEKDVRKMQISTENMPDPYSSLEYFPAYISSNVAEWNAYNKGDEVHFLVVDNPVKPGLKMAKLLHETRFSNSGAQTYIFVAESIGMNKTPNLKGKLQNPVEGISKASISKKNLEMKGIILTDKLIGKKFSVTLMSQNSQGNGWILDVIKLVD